MKSRCNLAVSIVESRHKTRSPMLSELWDYVFPCPLISHCVHGHMLMRIVNQGLQN